MALSYTTSKGLRREYGNITEPTEDGVTEVIETPELELSPTGIMLFGFAGRTSETGNLSSLSIIGYDTQCLNTFV